MTRYIQAEALRCGQPRQQEQPEHPASEQGTQEEDDDDRERKLDDAIEMTFPASDPISI